METNKIKISSAGDGREEVFEEVEKYAEYMGLDEKQTLRLRLLAEETMGMVQAITGDFSADFWMEGNDGYNTLHLLANTKMDLSKKEQLVELSSTGKNEAAKGFMGKVKELFENVFYNMDEVNKLSAEYDGGSIMYASMGMFYPEAAGISPLMYSWSLSNYRTSLEENPDNPASKEAWDELEKSIVASIADDVKVSVSKDHVELEISSKQR